MTGQEVSCLFCKTALETKEFNKKEAGKLSSILKRLCSALKLDFPLKFRKWNFSNEPFPFCLSCQKVILRLCRLMDQVKALELEISRCVSSLSMLTITSQSTSTESEILTAKEDISKRGKGNRKLLNVKHQYFRDLIIKRFNAKVRIERYDQNPDFVKAHTASPAADGRRKSVDEVSLEYHKALATQNYADAKDYICFDSSPVSPSPASEIWDYGPSPVEIYQFQEPSNSNTSETPTAAATDSNAPRTIASIASIPISAGWDYFETPNISFSPSPTYDNVEPEECVNWVSAAQQTRQQLSDPAEEIVETYCELDIKIEPLEDPNGASEQPTTLGNKDEHTRTSTVKNQRGAKRVPRNHRYRVERLGGGLFDLNGFGFKEFDEGFECSTCKETFSFPPDAALNAKWRNVKFHIEARHISKKDPPPTSSFKLQPEKPCEGNQVPGTDATPTAEDSTRPSIAAESGTVDVPVTSPDSSVIRFHAGFKISVLKEKALCLACGLEFESSAKESSMVQVQKHITKDHVAVRRTQDPSKNTKESLVLLDQERISFRVNGHEFQAQELEGGFQCSTCQKFFHFPPLSSKEPKWRNIKKHILTVHGRPGRCEVCSADVNNLPSHMRILHGCKSRICGLCGQEFKSKVSLAAHRTEVHVRSKPEPKFQCGDYGKTFRAKAKLKSHQRTHGGEKSYICEHCGKRFRCDHGLKTHLASTHGERKFACDQCDSKFGVRFLLNRHVRRVHQGTEPPPPTKKRKSAKESREEGTPESDSDTMSASQEKN